MLGTRRARRNQAYLSEHPTPNLQLPAQPSGCIHTICIFKLRRAGAEQKKKIRLISEIAAAAQETQKP